MRESWWRIDTRTGSYQFFCRSHKLPVAITFDPELRLTHSLWLREALVVLFTSIPHAKRGGWNGGLSMRTVIGCAWMLDGATKDRVLALSLASSESIRVETEPIRWAKLYVKNKFYEHRIDSQGE
ncbi:hypothetical protein PIB30_037057 [Stylosanthes scabra]|uniref:Uncharacterized protein n=1 Tax=Stylosanthes scabra TaxID=79078 RepID=A0ABU6VC88_9FABA|nr:hypothetical protein [Stylosanthes scabra]